MKSTLSILTFPQHWKNNQLTLRFIIIPRNVDPTVEGAIADNTVAWINASLAFKARLITDPEKYPGILEAAQEFSLPGLAMPADAGAILDEMQAQLGGIQSGRKLEPAKTTDSARKYLPESYRNSFNFTSPRTKDGVIDDSYRCAIRDSVKADPDFKSSGDSLSWGKVFAYCLRQPDLAERVGFVYEATITVEPSMVEKGGWIYVDLDEGCSYKSAMNAKQEIVKRFAARLPKLKDNRSLFAAIQFPVLIDKIDPKDHDIPVAPNNLDELLIEAAQYDDGFCKIVHANQPVSSDLHREEEDPELPVITDAGIRLGWDDEQLLIWMNRQLRKDPGIDTLSGRVIAPMGVLQYRVDVREAVGKDLPPNAWVPLCKVENKATLKIGPHTIDYSGNTKELGVEVYPARVDHRQDQPFWLPQYFAHWIGKSLVLADSDAITIFHKAQNNAPGKQAQNFDQYIASGLGDFRLLYGRRYQFRVRMADVSGGGPTLEDNRIYDAASPEGACDFRRYVQPQPVRLKEKLPLRDDAFFEGTELNMTRPLLGYPAVLFTGRYPNGVAELTADAALMANTTILAEQREVGLADPDVESVEVLVEVKALEMDMLLRHDKSSRESYAKLYSTMRKFPSALNGTLTIPIKFENAPVLDFEGLSDLDKLGLLSGGGSIDGRTEIILPRSRNLRITIRPVLRTDAAYFPEKTTLQEKGKPVIIVMRQEAKAEIPIFKAVAEIDKVRAVWLQPDTDTYLKANLSEIFVENAAVTNTSSMIENLVSAIDRTIDVESKGMSIVGKKGKRLQFGVSRFIRHNMSPDNTNFTFSTKADLLNHWIVPLTFLIDRDWTWDGAAHTSFKIYRQIKSTGEGVPDGEPFEAEIQVGDVVMKPVINIQALYGPDRAQTQLCFIDAVEPRVSPDGLPCEIMLSYRIEANFKELPPQNSTVQLHLPVTTKPAQVPRIVSAGIAQSIYIANDKYSATEPRKRYLWLEFNEPLRDKRDAYFIRMLAYSPDPLLSRWDIDMMRAPEEPALPIDPERIRIIAPDPVDDHAGLNAMQELIRSEDSDTHYLVPLPPGLHASSAELFGFYTYEIRVGHKNCWTTAQGRFGSVLRSTGVQHPPPQLFCTVSRNEKHIMVNAPYAQTVFNGADVTSNPPRTQLWALLYAQVKRADDALYRNILLDDQLLIRQRIKPVLNGDTLVDMNSDALQYGITGWRNEDVENILRQYGLPIDSNLSVLVVEMMPTYDKFYSPPNEEDKNKLIVNRNKMGGRQGDLEEGMEIQYFKNQLNDVGRRANEKQRERENDLYNRLEEQFIDESQRNEMIRPLTDQLGSERILRTSTLAAVPEICCAE
jgi:hypothetical protein